MKPKILIPLLTLACLLAMPATAQVNYAVSGGSAYVTSCSRNASGNIVIASTYNGYPVTSIGDFAFEGCSSLTSVTIPNSVTSIGNAAFLGCTSLTSVTIPSSVTSIGGFGGAPPFSFCTSLTNISVDAGNAVYSSLNGVLFNKAQTTLIQFPGGRGGGYAIPNTVTNIGLYAFGGCSSLTTVTIPNSVTSIGQDAFLSCTGLTSVTIPNSVTTIFEGESGAFASCTGLTNFSVDAANSVYSSLDGVLFDKAKTTLIAFPEGRGGSYAIPNSVTDIRNSAFASCTGLTSVTIPNSVTTIEVLAFGGCTGLTSVTIPNSVTTIGYGAFGGGTGLTNVVIGNGVTIIDGSAFYYCTNLTSVTIGNSVTIIRGYAFEGCSSLTRVTIPNSVTSIEVFAFYNCTSLTNFSVDAANPVYSSLGGVLFNKAQTTLIEFPDGRGGIYAIPNAVTSIGDNAFYNSTTLTSVTIPTSVMSIGVDAFVGCSSLTTVTIPNSVAVIGNYAFDFCTNLTSVTFLGNAPWVEAVVFDHVAPGAKVYYYYGTTGWGPTYDGLPTVMLGAPAPQVAAASAGMKPGGFGFALNGAVNQTIVVEASTNLVNWQSIWTNTLSTVSTNFVDPQSVNFPRRFYRLRSN